MSFSSVPDEYSSFAAMQHLHYRCGVLSKEANSKERSEPMEPNYLVIEDLVRQARQQRSQDLGLMISAGWNWCMKLFRSIHNTKRPQTALWRVLPP